MKYIENVIFDCGDTMLRLDPSREEICLMALKQIDIFVGLDFIKRAYYVTDNLCRMHSSKINSSYDRASYYEKYNQLLAIQLGIESKHAEFNNVLRKAFSMHRKWNPFSDLSEVLDVLYECKKLYVLANWDVGLKELLYNVGIGGYFKEIYSSAELKAEKPSSLIFERFIKQSGLKVEKSLYIGNEYEADVVGPRAFGIKSILVDRDNFYHDYVDTVKVKSLHEIINIVL